MMQLNQFANSEALNKQFAAELVTILQQAISLRGSATLVVSGGRTPQALFQQLSHADLAWDKVTITLADDRWLAADQADSNERLVKASLLQNRAAKAKFISLYANSASAFSGVIEVLPRIAGLPTFDAVILGMGEDGHTASLFPCSEQIAESLASDAPAVLAIKPTTAPYERITLSKSRLENTRHMFLHLVGAAKKTVLDQAMADNDVLAMPIRAFLQHSELTVSVMYAEQ
ncbi:6-phosphogluconolactonase [Rheinheimera sp. MMS21-TC3]|uniref:6-phosphogluconolactonase n=1 Tax=Rheinheimera sp. MMS21-TC3 TaxID=3072790 RepID=UPI0028C46D99|nr:6-phosphogluconolactonase [Rheinheimera sp. MMS21-TC3]WNO61065.1 6-phosphogluconolactonase [Rheinheimera sp. MMS21-TC3]